ncbi:MAG: phosphotransferase [Ilumatobacteraceae bacterium]
MGWEALGQWGADVARIEPLAGGVANDVWSVRVNGHLAVGRLGARSHADLAWETELLQHLDREGLTVPVPIPTTDGRLFAGGLVVMTYIEGGPPEIESVVHGDPNPRNICMTADRVALIDWDEAHVDAADLDLALPHNAAGLDDDVHDAAAQASAAWEAAVCWDDEYAVKRLAEVR